MATPLENIQLDDLSIGLYRIHLDNKNHRICKVLRTLMLRADFIPFLEKLEKDGLHEGIIERSDGKSFKLWQINFEVAGKMVQDYLDKVEVSAFFDSQNKDWTDNFRKIAPTIITQTYLDGYSNQKNKNTIFSKMVIFDHSLNYPNISEQVFDKETFWRVFNDAFYVNINAVKEKYGKHPSSIVSGGNKFDEIPNKENFSPTEPKVCQLVFDDTTEKQELIDYIDKNWGTIESSLKAWRPSRNEKRITSSANFVRDTEIYNKYQSFKKDGFKNPDLKVYSWLKNESDYKIEIEPNTIRKIVSLLKTDIESINNEK